MNTEDSIVLWKTRIQECKSSGQKVAAWCLENEVSRFAYYYWHRKIVEMEMEASTDPDTHVFVEVNPKEVIHLPKKNNQSEVVISWRDCFIKINDSVAIPLVVELLSSLEKSC